MLAVWLLCEEKRIMCLNDIKSPLFKKVISFYREDSFIDCKLKNDYGICLIVKLQLSEKTNFNIHFLSNLEKIVP